MKFKMIIILLSACLIAACQPMPKHKQQGESALTIEGISFTVEEFEEAFKRSTYGKMDTPAARKAFLDTFIMGRIMLRVAEKQGLDKDPVFLQDVEFFWQQSLLKLIIERQSQQIAKGIKIEDDEIKAYYKTHQARYFPNESLETVKEQIRAVLLTEKRQIKMKEWMNALQKQARVDIKHELLGIQR